MTSQLSTRGPRSVPPDLAQLRIFDSVPRWAIAHAASDDSAAPLIRVGEVAVVEGDGCVGIVPEDGGLYLIEYVTKPHTRYGNERRTRDIIRASRDRRGGWWARPHAAQGTGALPIICSDGPYRDELALAERILGRVVGIYRPASIPA